MKDDIMATFFFNNFIFAFKFVIAYDLIVVYM